jgi:hypothetical protein
LSHFLLMLVFAGCIAVVFGCIGREGGRQRFRYGLKVFLEFVVVGVVLAWVLYWLP